MRSALVIVACLLAAACSATGVSPRPLESGFASTAGVADPYEDGKRHLAEGRYEIAVKRFGQTLASDRRSLDALNGLAIAYTRLGRFDVAQTYFERALQVDAASAVTLNNYGWSLVEQGRLREARPFLELALPRAAEPDVPVVAANLESIRRAKSPALLAGLESDRGPGADSDARLVRVGANKYRLETATRAGVTPDFSVMAESAGGAGSAQTSAEHFRLAERDPDMRVAPQSGDTLVARPDPVPEPEAAAILAGDQT